MSKRIFNVSVSGTSSVLNKLNGSAAAGKVNKVTEAYARKVANEAAANAPVESGKLKASLASSPQKEEETVWTVGSDLPYALRQEYEHKTKKGFARRAAWDNRDPYRNKIKEVLKDLGR